MLQRYYIQGLLSGAVKGEQYRAVGAGGNGRRAGARRDGMGNGDAPFPARVLATAHDLSAWTASASDGVSAVVGGGGGPRRGGTSAPLRLWRRRGLCLAARALPVDWPDNFELTVELRSSAVGDDFELKFVDASGENVWWYRPARGEITDRWQVLRIRKRQVEFAWGPTADRRFRHTERFEVVVHAGRGGDRTGTLDVGEVKLQALPAPPSVWPAPRAVAADGGRPVTDVAAVDGDGRASWRCTRGERPCVLTLDYQVVRELGGVKLVWADGHRASRYEVAVSDDGATWRSVRRVTHGSGTTDWLACGELEARFVRVSLQQGDSADFRLAELSLLDVGLGSNPNALVASIARAEPRGRFPRGFSEQSYWTLVGFDGGAESALLSEDGALELGRGAPSIEPFVVEGGRIFTWADATTTQRLASGYLPIPTAEWRTAHFGLSVTAFANRGRLGEGVWARYQVTNRTRQPLPLRLVLAARPFQVNPPAQFLTTPGGVSPVERIRWDGRKLELNDRWYVVPLRARTSCASMTSTVL